METVVTCICTAFFRVSNLYGLSFANTFGKPIPVSHSAQRLADLTYLTFRSIVYANIVDDRAPATSLSIKFSLRLPQPAI